MGAEQRMEGLDSTAILHKEVLSEKAQKVYARPAYPNIISKAGCRIYMETNCGRKNCCFECLKRASCKEFEGGCEYYTKETYKNCPEIIRK